VISISVIKKRAKNHMDEVIVGMKDTGTGIHPEILPRLFSMFATGSEIGTGLGVIHFKKYRGSSWWEAMGTE
jgi:two-component system C4-dicarboxylate transport sensor histidine kinase DctB